LTIRERLPPRSRTNTAYARDLSISHTSWVTWPVAGGRVSKARRLFQQSLTIRERLAAAEPDNTVYARDLSVSTTGW